MMHRIRRVGVYQTSIVVAALYGVLGLLIAPVVYLMGRLPATEGAASLGRSFGLLMALGMPVMYAVLGFITTAIACVIYNLLAGMTGGIEIELVPSDRSV